MNTKEFRAIRKRQEMIEIIEHLETALRMAKSHQHTIEVEIEEVKDEKEWPHEN